MKNCQLLIKTFKKYLVRPNLIFIPILLLFVLLFVIIFDIYLQRKITSNAILLSPLRIACSDYPVLKNKTDPQLSAKAAVIVDRDSGVILFAKNENLRFAPASTPKTILREQIHLLTK